MYFNRLIGIWVFDALDIFLLSVLVSRYFTSYLKNYLSEDSKMKRLKNDIMSQSKLIKSSKSSTRLSFKNFKKLNPQKIYQKIYKVSQDIRGGADTKYQIAEKIQNLVLQLAIYLKKRELKANLLKFIFTWGRLALELLLSTCNIDLQFILVDKTTKQIAAVACFSGSITGFVCSWFSVGTFLLSTPTIVSWFLLRSWYQKIQHDIEYTKLMDTVTTSLKEEISNMVSKSQKQVANSKDIKLEDLSWNKNSAIREAAERLGIFENAPNSNKPLHLNTLDPNPDLKKILEELGIIKTRKPKLPNKAKTVNFKDFIGEMVDDDVIDAEFLINAEIVKEPIKIRIQD